MNKKSFFIAAFSALIQYYDYHLFGFLAAKIASVFIPSSNNVTALLSAYFIMALGMIAKPIGSLALGKIGDTRGRSVVVSVSLTGSAIATLLIALMPGFEEFGIISSFMILIARMITCGLVSPGIDGVRIYIYEHITKERKALGVALTNVFTQLGSLTASVSAWFFCLDFLPDYSWRGAFLIGGILGLGLVWLKRHLNITDQINLQDDEQFSLFANLSIYHIVRQHLKLFIWSVVLAGSIGSTVQFIIIFFGTYNYDILGNISKSQMQLVTSIGILIYMTCGVLSGIVTDKFGKYNTALVGIGAAFIIALGFILALMNNEVNITLFLIINIALPFATMPAAVILKAAMPAVIRYRIFSLAHAIGSILISAPTAFVSTLLYHKSGIAWLPVGYFFFTLIMMLCAIVFLTELRSRINYGNRNPAII